MKIHGNSSDITRLIGSGHCLMASVIFAVLLAAPIFAQEDNPYSARASTGPTFVGAHDELDGQATSSGQQNQAPSQLPDAPSAAPHPASGADRLTFGERTRIYASSIVRPYSLIGPAFGAGIGQLENEPPAWGQGGEGYAKRLASGMSRHLISETIRYGVAAADGEDPRYHRSQESGFWNRSRNVIVETFTSETASGKRIPAYSRFAGLYGAAFISNSWYPDNRATAGWALRRGSTALGASLGYHFFEEFVPRKFTRALRLPDSSDAGTH
jgi:hypothetical protein